MTDLDELTPAEAAVVKVLMRSGIVRTLIAKEGVFDLAKENGTAAMVFSYSVALVYLLRVGSERLAVAPEKSAKALSTDMLEIAMRFEQQSVKTMTKLLGGQ